MMLEITSSAMARLLDEAELAAGRECCGLLLGSGARIDTIAAAENVAPDPALRFEIDPATLVAAHRAARAGGPEVLGYYHSHPTGHPLPSATDCEHLSGDSRVWAIVSGGAVGFWRDIGSRFETLSSRVVDG